MTPITDDQAATHTVPPRPPVVLTLVVLVATVVVGLVALKWITSLVMLVVQLALIGVGFYLIARIGWYLLRKGSTGPRG